MAETMKIIAPLSVMDINDPWADDKLNTKALSPILTSAIATENEPCVISVNGKWGCGKSFFLQRWVQELKNSNWQALYFNAWEDDFIEDPLVALIGQLYSYFIDNPKFSGCMQEITDAVRKIGPVVKTIAEGFTEQLTGVDVKEIIRQTKFAFNLSVEEYQSLSQNRKVLREKLQALAQKTRESVTDDVGNKPVVFVIDELDRCRPDFAVKILERVKHLMSVPGIVFVFGIDRDQLSKTIKSVYGDIDAENYLRRFFDLDFKMPEPNVGDFIKYQFELRHIRPALEKLPHPDGCVDNANNFKQIFVALSQYHALTLREVESACKIFIFIVRGYFCNKVMLPSVIAIMILLRVRRPDLYVRVIYRNIHPRELLEFLAGMSELDDYWAWKEIVFGAYFICGETLHENGSWAQLKKYCEGTTTFAAADKIFPLVFQMMSQDSKKSFLADMSEFETRGHAGYWNGAKAVGQVGRAIDNFDVSTLGQ